MKKGFTLIELLVSLVIISMVIIFITAFIVNLKDEKDVAINIPEIIDKISISKELNNDAIKYGVSNIQLENENKKCTIKYKNDLVRVININGNNIKYTDGDNVIFAKSLPEGVTFTQIDFDYNNNNYYEDMSVNDCVISEWIKSGKICEGTYNYSDISTSSTLFDSCTIDSSIPTSCTSSNAGTTYVTACPVGKNTCRKPAKAGTCLCNINGKSADVGGRSSQNVCQIACNENGGTFISWSPSTSYTCPDGGNLIEGYCYLNRGTYPCISPWILYQTKYYKSTKTCEATYSFTNFSNQPTAINCEIYNGNSAPTTCNASNIGEYITSCVASSQQCTQTVGKKYFKYVIGLSNNDNIEVYYYGD